MDQGDGRWGTVELKWHLRTGVREGQLRTNRYGSDTQEKGRV